MAYFVQDTDKGQRAYKTHLMDPKKMNVFNSDLALKILDELSKKPQCAMDIARKLKQHEQKIYYHLRRMQSVGIVNIQRTEMRVGALTKIFSVSHPYLTVKLFDGEHIEEIKTKAKEIEFFHPFIRNGKLDATIVVGSPDPHGKYGVQASDGYAAIDFALLLGTLLKSAEPNYKLDTHIRDEDMKQNLILIGGPKANILIEKINNSLPIYFDTKNEFNMVSTFTKTTYDADEIGILIKMPNPFAKDKHVLIISGKRFKGTRAGILAVTKYLKKLEDGNKFDSGVARVVRGIDRDSDGRIDDVEFLE